MTTSYYGGESRRSSAAGNCFGSLPKIKNIEMIYDNCSGSDYSGGLQRIPGKLIPFNWNTRGFSYGSFTYGTDCNVFCLYYDNQWFDVYKTIRPFNIKFNC